MTTAIKIIKAIYHGLLGAIVTVIVAAVFVAFFETAVIISLKYGNDPLSCTAIFFVTFAALFGFVAAAVCSIVKRH